MTDTPRPGHARVRFDELAWARDAAAATPASRDAAERTRAQLDRSGTPISALRACEPEAAGGTRLPGCLKLYVPTPAGPWGIVFQLAVDAHGPFLAVLAFGLRHPPAGRRSSVYQIAHRRFSGD